MLVSGSAQAPVAGVAGPAQPTEVGLRARVSFDLPSSPSPPRAQYFVVVGGLACCKDDLGCAR